jgi:hypothetical protein
MSMIPEVLRSVIKSRPILVTLVLSLLGCVLGWWLIGYLIWPVQYVGDSYPKDLKQEDRDAYLTMVADSYSINENLALVTTRLRSWTPEEQASLLTELAEIHEQSGQVEEAANVRKLLSDLRAAPVEPVEPAEAGATPPPSGVTPATPVITGRPRVSWLARLPLICGVVVLVILVIAGAGLGFSMIRRRQAAQPSRAAVPEARRPTPYWEAGAPPPLGSFITTYMLGDDHYDESFSIETPMGEFLGECGAGISETIGMGGSPDKVTAFEVWLFDKSDIRTVTKVLMSEHAYHDDALRAKLASKGEAVLATPGQVITLETAALLVKAEVTEMVYGSDDLPPQSHFAKLTLEMAATAKSPGGIEEGEAL